MVMRDDHVLDLNEWYIEIELPAWIYSGIDYSRQVQIELDSKLEIWQRIVFTEHLQLSM